jgi:hypothetical protein
MKAPETIRIKANHWWGEEKDTLEGKKEGEIALLCFGDVRSRNIPYVVRATKLNDLGQILEASLERYRAKKPG